MIRLATQEDRTTIERLCAKEPWDGTEVMTAYLRAVRIPRRSIGSTVTCG